MRISTYFKEVAYYLRSLAERGLLEDWTPFDNMRKWCPGIGYSDDYIDVTSKRTRAIDDAAQSMSAFHPSEALIRHRIGFSTGPKTLVSVILPELWHMSREVKGRSKIGIWKIDKAGNYLDPDVRRVYLLQYNTTEIPLWKLIPDASVLVSPIHVSLLTLDVIGPTQRKAQGKCLEIDEL